MKFTGILIFLVMILTGFSSRSQDSARNARAVSLNECLSLSIANSPHLKVAALEQLRLEYSRKSSVGAGLPHFGLSGSFDDFFNLPTQMIPNIFSTPPNPSELIPVQFGTAYNMTGAIEASQLLYNQSWLTGLKLAKQMEQQNELMTEKTRTNLIYDVAQSYYLAQITAKQINNITQNIDKLEKAEKIASSQYDSGLIIRIDVDRIMVQKLNLQTELERLQVVFQQQLAIQKYYMGFPQETAIFLSDSITLLQDSFKAGIPDQHIDMRIFEKQKQLAGTNIKLNKAAWYPNLSLIASANYANQSNTFYLFGKPSYWFNTSLVGLRFSMPLFSGMEHRYRVNQSFIELEKLKVLEEDARKVIGINSEDAMRKLLSGREAEKRQRENMKLAEKVFNVTQEQYQKGVVPLSDLLNAETALGNAQTNHSYALIQVKINELDYMKANGQLLDHFKL